MILDYLSDNGLKKYPFQDGVSLFDTTKAFSFPNNFFLDIIFVAKVSTITGTYLSSYQNQYGSSQFVITFTTLPGNTVITLTIPYSSVVEKGLITYADSNVAIKIVPGWSFAQAKTGVDDTVYNFNQAGTLLAVAAVILMVPSVSSIAFYNWDGETNTVEADPVAIFTGNQSSPLTNLIISAGSNIDFELDGNILSLDVIRGAGTGLYNGCTTPTGVINTINYIPPSTLGNFLLETDDCYTVTPITHGLDLENTCAPKCTAEQLNNFAYYNNRITDGLTTVYTYADSIYNDIATELERYTADVLPTVNKPHYKIASLQSPSIATGKGYLTFSIGLFNPTNSSITYSFSASGGTLATHSLGPSSGSGTIPCLQHKIVTFTMYGTTGTTVTISGMIATVTISGTGTI